MWIQQITLSISYLFHGFCRGLDQRRFKDFVQVCFNRTTFTFHGCSGVDMMASLPACLKETEGEPEAWEVRTRTEFPA